MVFLLVCVVKACCSVIDLIYSYLGKTGNKWEKDFSKKPTWVGL